MCEGDGEFCKKQVKNIKYFLNNQEKSIRV